MKKFISLILAIISVVGIFSLCACNGDSVVENEEYEGIQLGEGDGALNVNEATIRSLLAAYPQKALGLKKEIYDYDLKLSKAEFKENAAVKVEACPEGEKDIEATFMFLGTQFYIYDKNQKKYLKLTVNGPVEETEKKEDNQQTKEEIEADNNSQLHKKYSKYDMSVVKLPKDISEYNFLVTGNSAVATDKETVYVINVLEKNGEDTGYRLAIGKKGDYYFNVEKDRFVKLKTK